MNKNCFRLVFSRRLNTLVVVGENVLSAGKAASGARVSTSALDVGVRPFSLKALLHVMMLATAGQLWLSGFALAQTAPLASNALPTGGKVVAGNVATNVSGSTMTINQGSDKAVVNWNSFNVGSTAKVNIVQPGSNAVILNRVVGNDPTQIQGQLSANGQVMLVNPNGVVVGKDGVVSASGFTASSYGISDADFLAGKHQFDRNGTTAGVRNDGKIQTTAGGYVALIGAEVTNNGQIIAPQGTVVMAAAESVTVPGEVIQVAGTATATTTDGTFAPTVSVPLSGRVRLSVTAAAINTAVTNTKDSVIVTEGGQVLLQAAAMSDAVASVTHSGRIDSSGARAGAVTLQADGGRIKVDGSIKANSSDVNAAGGTIIIGHDEQTGKLSASSDVSGAKLESRGGFVETSGDYLKSDGVSVMAKTWLLDPVNVEINATATPVTAGDTVVLASDINAALNLGTSVTISTGTATGSSSSATGVAETVVGSTQNNGHLYVNTSIAKTLGGTASLTLIANSNIYVAAGKTITSTTGALNVLLNANSSGTGGAIVMNTGSGITSNGGSITLGGGSGLNGSGFATADGVSTLQGISLYSATINAGGGNIVMNGLSPATPYQSNLSDLAGILIAGAGTISTTGAGTITLSGNNQTGNMGTAIGFVLKSGNTITGGSTGAVTIVGDSRSANTGYSNINGALISGNVTSTGGNINITGYGGQGAQYDTGLVITGNITAVATGAISLAGTGSSGSSGGNMGVSISGSSTISSVDGSISITGTGGTGNGAVINDHGVVLDSTNTVQSTGAGNITIKGTTVNVDNGFSKGVVINRGGVTTATGNVKLDGAVAAAYETSVYVNAPVRSLSGGYVYVRSAGGSITNTATGTISANNVSIDNSNGSIDTTTGAITNSTAGASSVSGVISPNGVDIKGSITATNNLNIYGNQTGFSSGVSISGATVTVSGKNLAINGKSSTGNGVTLTGSTISGDYINAVGTTATGYNGFAWSGGNITTTGTGGTSAASTVKGISGASTTASNGYGALMMYANGAVSAIAGTTLTLEGNATTSAAGQNTKERGILVQSGYTLTSSGNITLKGTSNNGEGIAFGGTINETGADSQLSIIGVASATSNASLSAVNFSGTINGNTSTGPISILGTATNTSGTSYDTAVTFSGTIAGGSASNVIVQAAYGKMAIGGTISGTNISIDNTGGTINTTAGATDGVITAGSGTSNYTNAISLTGSVAATGNINILGKVATATNTGVNLSSTGSLISSGTAATINITSNGNIVADGAIKDTGATGTGSSINLTSTSGGVSGIGSIGDTTNKNVSVTFTQSGTSIYDGAINAANFTKAGTGALTLDSWITVATGATAAPTNISNSYTVKDGGGLTVSPTSAYPTMMVGGSVNVENNSSFTTSTGGNGWWQGTSFNFTGGLGGGTMNLGGNPAGKISSNTISTSGGATNTVTGGFNSNSMNLNLNLTAATGGTTLLDGSFAALNFSQNAQSAAGLYNGGTVTMSGGGNLLINDNVRAATFNINSGNVQVGRGVAATYGTTATLDATNINIASGSTLTFDRLEAYTNASVIGGTGNLVQAGAGALTLTGNSIAFAGATTVNAGDTLNIGTGGSLGAAGSTLTLSSATSKLQFTDASGVSTVGSTISGAGTVTQVGAGTGVLTANNTYSGATTISAGTLQVGNGGTTGSLGTYAGAITDNGTLAYNLSTNVTVANQIIGTGALTQMGSGTTTLTANNTYAGITTVSAGTLQVGNGGTTGTLGAGDVTLSNNSNLYYDRSAATTIANNISGTGNVSATILGTTSNLTVDHTISLTSGTINLVADGNLTLTNAISTTNATTSAIFLEAGKPVSAGDSSGGNVIFSGSGAATAASGRVTIETGSIAGSTGLNTPLGNSRYNSDEVATNYTTALGATGQYVIYREKPVINVQVNNVTKTYDGQAYTGGSFSSTLAGGSLFNGDTLASATSNSTYGGSAQNVVNATTTSAEISASQTASSLGYDVTYTSGALTVNKANIAATGTMVYDSTLNFSSANLTSITGVNGETFTASGTGSLSTVNVQSNQNLGGLGTLTLTAVGSASLSNYNALTTAQTTVSVTPRTLTVTGANNSSTYSGVAQTNTGASFNGLQGFDTFTVNGYGTGTNASTTPYADNLSLSGSGSSLTTNYTINYVNGGLTIGKANLSAIGSMVYGATTNFSGTSLTNITGVNGETFTASGAGTLSTANVQTNQNLASLGTLSLTGVGAASLSNYNTLTTAQTSVSVTQKALTVVGANNSSTYTGLVQTNTGATVSGKEGSDSFTVAGYAAGTNASTTAYTDSLSVTGVGSTLLSNYSVTYTNGGLTIGKANLTASGSMVYDASTNFTGANLTSITGVNGETFTATGTGTLSTANVQNSQNLSSVGTLTLSGNSGALTSNYNTLSTGQTSVSVTPRALTVTGTNGNVTYNGATQTNTAANLVGVQGLDSFTVNGYGSGKNASTTAYADNLSLAANGTTLLTNYSVTYTNGGLTIGKANLTASGSKVYDATTNFTGANLTAIAGVNGETFTATGTGTLSSANVQSNQNLAGLGSLSLLGNGGALTSNYNTLTTAQTSVSVTQKTLTVTGANNSGTYSGLAQMNSGATVSGNEGSDSFTVAGYATGTNASTVAYADSLSVTGAGSTLLSNYSVNYINGSLLIGKANLSASGTMVYDATTNFTGANLTSITGVNGETFTASGAGALTTANVQSSQNLSSVGTLTLSGNSGALTSNYNTLSTNQTSVSVTPRALTVTGTNGNVTYNGAMQTNTAANLVGVQGLDSFTVNGYGSGKNASTTAYADNLSLAANGSTLLTNYSVTYTNGGLTVGKANLTASGSMVYDATTTFAGSNLTSITGVNGETFTATGSGTLVSANVQTNQNLLSTSGLTLSSVGTALVSNYNALSAAQTSVSVTPRALTVTGANNSSIYSGLTQTNSGAVIVGRQGSDSFTVNGYASGLNASTTAYADSLSLTPVGSTALSNYAITYTNGGLTIGQATLTATLVGVSKVYDGTTAATLTNANYNLQGFKQAEGATITQTLASYQSKDVSSNSGTGLVSTSLTTADYTANAGTLLSNYVLATSASGNVGTITPAALTIKVNNASTFVTLDPTAASSGPYYSYTGLKNGESATQALVSAPGVGDRTYTGSANPVAGIYVNAYGLNAIPVATNGNYTVTVQNGTLTVVPAGTLLISIAGESINYGTVSAVNAGSTAQTVTAKYLDLNGGLINTLTTTNLGSGNWRATDSTGTSVTFSATALNTTASSGGYLNVGNYNFDATPIVPNVTPNFTASVVNGGVLTVSPIALTAGTLNLTKQYDGTASVTGVVLSPSGVLTGDQVTATASNGAFATPNAGTNISYTLTGLFLSGLDAANYSAPVSVTGTGKITPKQVTLAGVTVSDKVYDGTTTATVSSNGVLTGLVGTEKLTYSTTALFSNKNAGTNKAVTLDTLLGNGVGGLASNYTLAPIAATTATITPKTIDASFLGQDKKYDGTTTATVTGSLSGLIAGDQVSVTNGSANFESASAGTNKLINVGLLGLDGLDAGNYSLSAYTAITYASIIGLPPVPEPKPNQVVPSGSVSNVMPSRPSIQVATSTASQGSVNSSSVSSQGRASQFGLAAYEERNICTSQALENCICEEERTSIDPAEEVLSICYEPTKRAVVPGNVSMK